MDATVLHPQVLPPLRTRSATAPLLLRRATPADASACGQICYDAFTAISTLHNFPPDFPSPEVATGLMTMLLGSPDVYGMVAEEDGRVVGSCFTTTDAVIAGLGPITIDPAAQNRAVGRRLMEDALAYVDAQGLAGVRLVQAAFHTRSLALYTKLGFDVREPLVALQGPALQEEVPGYMVRPATEADLDACAALSRRVVGFARTKELHGAIRQGTATVVEHAGRMTGYATLVGYFGHATAATNDSLKALIGAAPAFPGSGLLLPAQNAEVFRWALDRGLRVVQPMTLMSRGLYTEPAGAVLPSILF